MIRARRLVLVFAAFVVLGLGGLVVRLAFIQGTGHAQALERQLGQSSRVALLEARRGDLADRYGRPLARSYRTAELWVWPPNLTHNGKVERTPDEVAESVVVITDFLAPRLGLSEGRIEDLLLGTKYRRLGGVIEDPALIEELQVEMRHTLRRLDLNTDWTREYPWGRVGGNVAGFLQRDGGGVSGVERGLDDLLAGVPGMRRNRVDVSGRTMWSPEDQNVEPLDGLDVVLTLDLMLQQFVEQELARAVAEQDAAGAAGVLLEIGTGEILALASVPTLDASDRSERPKEAYRHRAVEDLYAPGSTFKPLMMAAALDLGLVTPDMRIECGPEQSRFGSRKVSDTKEHPPRLSPEEVLLFSSNIGMGRILTRLVPEDQSRNTELMAPVHEVIMRLGLGRRTGVPLPFEAAGTVTPLEQWKRNYTLVSVSFGYELGATLLQVAAAVASLGDGFYRTPRLVRAVREDGAWRTAEAGAAVPVFDPRSAQTVRRWMTRVVEESSGKAARVAGVPIAGKTGTSFKESDRSLETHSFVALVPADAPRLALAIMIDEPKKGRYSSQTTVPAAGRILARTLSYLGETP